MAHAERLTARKEYRCNHCKGRILPKQEYLKRNDGYKVHNRTRYDEPTRWHANHCDCQSHKENI